MLASGRRSTLYVDCRLTTMSPEGQMLIGREALAALRDSGWPVDSVGGLTLGADPISYAIAHASALEAEAGTGEMVRSFTVRKEAKQHGTGKLIEGPFQPGDKVVVVEDDRKGPKAVAGGAGHQTDDHGRIEPAGEECAEWHIAAKPQPDGFRERAAQFVLPVFNSRPVQFRLIT